MERNAEFKVTTSDGTVLNDNAVECLNDSGCSFDITSSATYAKVDVVKGAVLDHSFTDVSAEFLFYGVR